MTKEQTQKALIEIYQQIPSMNCRPGCTKCCGFIPWSKFEYDQLREKKDLRFLCLYPHKGRCSIYAQRPFICRLFGTVAPPHILGCPEGCKPAFALSKEQARQLLQSYQRLLKGDPFLNKFDL